MNLLITLADFKAYRPITDNIDTVNKLDPYIMEAQMFDLKDAMGEAFFYDFLSNITDDKYQTLLNGDTYTNLQNYTVEFGGLKPVLAYFAYARYLENSGATDTAYGPVTKKNDWSQPISEKTLARKVTNARSSARAYYEQVLCFLRSNTEDYPLWNTLCGSPGKPSGGIKISAVGGDNCNDGYYNERFNPPYYR